LLAPKLSERREPKVEECGRDSSRSHGRRLGGNWEKIELEDKRQSILSSWLRLRLRLGFQNTAEMYPVRVLEYLVDGIYVSMYSIPKRLGWSF
jgi:hypothetical protein